MTKITASMYEDLNKAEQKTIDSIISEAEQKPIKEIDPKELNNLRKRYASLPEGDFLDLITGNKKLKDNKSFVDRERDKYDNVKKR